MSLCRIVAVCIFLLRTPLSTLGAAQDTCRYTAVTFDGSKVTFVLSVTLQKEIEEAVQLRVTNATEASALLPRIKTSAPASISVLNPNPVTAISRDIEIKFRSDADTIATVSYWRNIATEINEGQIYYSLDRNSRRLNAFVLVKNDAPNIPWSDGQARLSGGLGHHVFNLGASPAGHLQRLPLKEITDQPVELEEQTYLRIIQEGFQVEDGVEAKRAYKVFALTSSNIQQLPRGELDVFDGGTFLYARKLAVAKADTKTVEILGDEVSGIKVHTFRSSMRPWLVDSLEDGVLVTQEWEGIHLHAVNNTDVDVTLIISSHPEVLVKLPKRPFGNSLVPNASEVDRFFALAATGKKHEIVLGDVANAQLAENLSELALLKKRGDLPPPPNSRILEKVERVMMQYAVITNTRAARGELEGEGKKLAERLTLLIQQQSPQFLLDQVRRQILAVENQSKDQMDKELRALNAIQCELFLKSCPPQLLPTIGSSSPEAVPSGNTAALGSN